MESVCNECHKPMFEGYVIELLQEKYYCKQKCLDLNFSESHFNSMHDEGSAYWTDWYDEENTETKGEIQMNKGQEIVTCKKCGSNKVQDTGGKGGVLFTGFMMVSLGMWIPIIGWFIMIPVGLLMMIAAIISMFFKTTERGFKCRECKHMFTVPMESFKEYKEFLK